MSSSDFHGGVSIRGLRFRYDRGFAMEVARLDVPAGEQALFAGSSGCGKSTLLHLIAGIETPESGSILIGGTDICALSGGARDTFRGRHVGMVFQTFQLLHGFTALENVMLSLMLGAPTLDRPRIRAEAALERLGMLELHAPVERLSVGQQQRVAVARAVVTEPSVVLADEPTASLDPANAATAVELIRGAAQAAGAALIVTSHDPSLRSAFTRIVDVAQFGLPAPAPRVGAAR
ncbi:MAG: ATP-binding cassette domain-containing protein [Planctomycetes bacterium]|nr:ATP-binding cassette domain-containing protein [Planctomycetota bacterium]